MNRTVSVIVRTYNHEEFIKDCILSIVNQKTKYNVEILVGNDNSTDNTSSILEELESRYRNIKIFNHNKNLGALSNYQFLVNKAQGDYICVCDGDDYFLPNKIETQADYLDVNPGCNIVWHAMELLYSNGDLKRQIFTKNCYRRNKIGVREVLFYGTVGCFSSRMYRSEKTMIIPMGVGKLDNVLDVEAISSGYGVMLTESVLGGYRVGIGIASSGEKIHNLLIENIKALEKFYPEYRAEITANSFLEGLVCLKSRISTWKKYFLFSIKKSSIKSFQLLIKLLFSLKSLRLSSERKNNEH